MGKSAKGGVYGFLRGKVGSASYSILSGKRSSSGKKEQIVRLLPDNVSNPQTIAQCLQRMKIAPAHRFYNALSVILSNAFQGVEYGDKSRLYFLKKVMEQQGGPYIRKDVDRFLPADYMISEGELETVKITRPNNNVPGEILLNYDVLIPGGGEQIQYQTNEKLAELLRVGLTTQISAIVIVNDNGVFVPHYAGFSNRVRIQDLPAETIIGRVVSNPGGGNISLSCEKLGLPTANIVAYAVILSVQDAGGSWLRSTQTLIVNDDIYNQLYSEDAMNQAIASYQASQQINALNSQWYLNLGTRQPYYGRLSAGMPPEPQLAGSTFDAVYLLGTRIEVIDNSGGIGGMEWVITDYFATSLEDNGQIITIVNGAINKNSGITKEAFLEQFPGASVLLYEDSYASQAGF